MVQLNQWDQENKISEERAKDLLMALVVCFVIIILVDKLFNHLGIGYITAVIVFFLFLIYSELINISNILKGGKNGRAKRIEGKP